MENINSWNDIPKFDNIDSEVKFWQNHQLSPTLMNSNLHKPNTRDSTTITLRFDPRMLSKIKRIARLRYLNYQSMIKQWLSERLEEESRKNN